MKLLIFVISLFSTLGIAQLKTDTVFLVKSANNKIYLDNNYQKIFHHNIDVNSDNYFPIYPYKGKYYLYKSCDGYNGMNIIIKKDSVILYRGETQNFNITNKQANKNIISYTLNNQNVETKMDIKKYKKNAYLVKLDNLYYLMTNDNKTKYFPIIVNDCSNEKVNEFKFDKLDAKALFESTNSK